MSTRIALRKSLLAFSIENAQTREVGRHRLTDRYLFGCGVMRKYGRGAL
jgi:hypothetical protein